MLQSSVKLAVVAFALVACTQGARSGSSNGNAAIAGAVDATSLAAMGGQALRISVVGTQLSTRTDASGKFSLAGLAPGSADLRFQAQGIDATLHVSGLVPKQTMQISVRVSAKGVALLTSENEVAFVAAIDAVGTSSLTISGLEVDVDDTTRIVARRATIPLSTLKVNQIVAVEGTLKGGKVLARLVDLLLPASFDQMILRGTIDSLAAPSFVVSGLTIATDANTRFRRGLAFAGLKAGDRVAVQGTLQPDGTVLASIVRDLDQDPVRVVAVEGAVTAIAPPDHLTVAGVTVVVNADTRIEGEGGGHRGPDLRVVSRGPLSHDDEEDLTFADLAVGDQVEVEGLAQADGSVLALKIEVERNDVEAADGGVR
jgi:hypothetical protein